MELRLWDGFIGISKAALALGAFLIVGGVSTGLRAQTPGAVNAPDPAAISPDGSPTNAPAAGEPFDASILSQMHQINVMEIKAGNLAESKGDSEEVRAYGKWLANDHQYADSLLENLAAQQHLALPSATAQQLLQAANLEQKLDAASGADFDHAFLAAMIQGHTEAIEILNRSYDRLSDPEVRKFVGRVLPILQQHVQLAHDILHQNVRGDIHRQKTE